MVIIILSVTIVALIGYIFKLKFTKPHEKPIKKDSEKEKEMKKAFDNLMKYDFEIAIRRK